MYIPGRSINSTSVWILITINRSFCNVDKLSKFLNELPLKPPR